MPFTAAHPAAILPLLHHKRWFSATGLVAGSIAPDFQYFLLLPLFNHSGHSLQGLLFFNLPVGLLVATVFHVLVRRAAVHYLPHWLKARALAVPTLNWLRCLRERWFAVSVSVIIGAATHIFWDAFTSDTGYFVQVWPVLKRVVTLPLLGSDMMLCRILQHTSTVVGSLVLLVYTWRQPTVALHRDASPAQKAVFWLGIALAGFAFMTYALYGSEFMRSLRGVVVSFISGVMLATVVVSTVLQLNRARQSRP